MIEFNSIGPMILSMIMMNANSNVSISMIFMKVMYISLFQLVFTMIKCIQENICSILDPFWNIYFTKKTNIFKLQANITYKNNTIYEREITPVFKAVMHDIYTSITNLSSNNNSHIHYTIQDISINYENTLSMKMVIFPNSFQVYEPYPDIFVKLDTNTVIPEKVEYKYVTYSITISSKYNNYDDISKYIDICMKNYDVEQSNILKSQHIFILSNVQNDNNRYEITFNTLRFDTTKTFDTMFFEEKQPLVSYIDYFIHNKDKYQKLGKPYTCGLLLHGCPGTGKTSFIKALAKYTDRHIVVLPGKKIKSIDILKHIFMHDNLNDIVVPHNKRLYVFEEIDCNEWKHVVCCRNNIHEDDSNEEPQNLEQCMQNAIEKILHKNDTNIDNNNTTRTHKSNKSSDLNLGDFLDILDGIIEIPGRMIVMTSNHPQHLDPALLRPGRIDRIIEFKKMRLCDIRDMFALWFHEGRNEITFESCVEKYDIHDYKYSQAEIGQLFERIIAEKRYVQI